MYNHWFSVIQLVSIKKEKHFPVTLKHLALLGGYSSEFLCQISLIYHHSYIYDNYQEKLLAPCGCRQWRKLNMQSVGNLLLKRSFSFECKNIPSPAYSRLNQQFISNSVYFTFNSPILCAEFIPMIPLLWMQKSTLKLWSVQPQNSACLQNLAT